MSVDLATPSWRHLVVLCIIWLIGGALLKTAPSVVREGGKIKILHSGGTCLKAHSNHDGVYVCFVCFKRTHENIGNLLLILVSVFWQEDRTEHKLSHFCGPSSHKHVTIVTWYTNYVRQTLGWKNIISQTKAPFVEEDIDYGETTYPLLCNRRRNEFCFTPQTKHFLQWHTWFAEKIYSAQN